MQKRMPYHSYRKFLGACFESKRGNFQLSKELGSFTEGNCNHRKRQPRKFQNLPADSVLDLISSIWLFLDSLPQFIKRDISNDRVHSIKLGALKGSLGCRA